MLVIVEPILKKKLIFYDKSMEIYLTVSGKKINPFI